MTHKDYPTAAARREQNRADMIDDILAIAREMMRADGVAALSFNAIARRLGMKPPSLYTYFDSKHAIYDALFRRGFEQFAERMAGSVRDDVPLVANLRCAFENYMGFAQENPDLYQLMFQRPVPGFAPSEASMAVSLGALEASRVRLRALIAAGDIQTDLTVEEAHDLVIALMHGMTELHLANNPDLPVGQGRFGGLIDQAISFVLDAWSA